MLGARRVTRPAVAPGVRRDGAAGRPGNAGGLASAWGLVSLARSFLPEEFLAHTLNVVEVDWRAVAATSLLGLVAAVAAGLPPAWIGTALNPG